MNLVLEDRSRVGTVINAGTRMKAIVSCVATVVAAVAMVGAADQQAPKTDTKSIVRAATEYVERYQREFASLVADEEYTQTSFGTSTTKPLIRQIRGEMFLAYLPADRAWIAVHDVAEVDGIPVPDRGNVRDLLVTGAWQSVAARVADLNARYNIGPISRNINEPTFALKVFEPQRIKNFKFDRAGVMTRPDGPPLVTLEFLERDRPTIVKAPLGEPIYSTGEIVVEAGSGRIVRTSMRFDKKPIEAHQETEYAVDERLGLLVPVVYRESYATRQASNLIERTTCEARYTNYRRFAATGRIK